MPLLKLSVTFNANATASTPGGMRYALDKGHWGEAAGELAPADIWHVVSVVK